MEVDTEHRLNTDVSQSPSVDVDMMSSSMDTPDLKAALSRETSSQPTVDNHVPVPAHNEGRATQFTARDTKTEPAS